MKKQVRFVTAVLVIVLGCATARPVCSQGQKPDNQPTVIDAQSSANAAAAMKGLRDRLFTTSPREIGLSGEDAQARVWGAVTEIGFPGGILTLVSLRDGTASIYTNTGGGILGGYSAQKEAKLFVAEAEKHLAEMTPTKSFPYPSVGRVKFYVLTQEGVYGSEAGEQELFQQQNALSPLHAAGVEVIIALRVAGERSQTKKP